jgi:cell wall-associated NlpC family hydrolase
VPTPPAGTPVTRPVSTALSLTVFGAAAAVTAVVAPPPTAVETTGSLAPVQSPAPAPGAVGPVATLPAAPALAALPDEPTMQVDNLVTQVTGEMAKVDRPYTTVANTERLSSPAAMRKAAMTNALAKLGTPYRWGAMGPNAFDCSGLVKWSFANAGKSLPRTSRAMAGVGVPVSKSQLQPGDLVFFYKPISHVGIYIGNGKIVHASRKGQPVKISDMSNMRFSGARRVV